MSQSSTPEKVLIAISRVNTLLHRQLSQLFRQYDLTLSQFAILEALLHKGPLCIRDIQAAILSTAGNVPVVVNNLVKLNYVEKRQGKEDRRQSFIHLTEAGRELVEKVYPLQRELMAELLDSLSEDQMEELLALLWPLQTSLKQIGEN